MPDLELKNCPWCGKIPAHRQGVRLFTNKIPGMTVYCETPKCPSRRGGGFEFEEWNNRTEPTLPDAMAVLVKAKDVLKWYQEQSRLCRLIHREGDEGRNNLAQDGGKRAEQTLPEIEAAIGEKDD